MTKITSFSNPLLLGFDMVEKTLERVVKSGDGYPPYNIERLHHAAEGQKLRITLAVAGFEPDELDVTVENNQLIICGRQVDNEEHEYLHRGIASRQFRRIFVLADGMYVAGAELKNGLLLIDLDQPVPEKNVRRIAISTMDD